MQIQIPWKFLTVLWQETSLLNSITKQIKVNFIISTDPYSRSQFSIIPFCLHS